MKFLVIGNGFVGSAVAAALEQHHEIIIKDPPKGMFVDYNDHPDLDGAIICVPTPQSKSGTCDDSLVKSYYRSLRQSYPTLPIMIKSTTSITTLNMFDGYGDSNIVFSPEFLTAANAKYEFANPSFVVLSGSPSCASFWADNVYMRLVDNDTSKIAYLDKMSDAGFVKYTINSYLATKVTFFNELHKLYHVTGYGDQFDDVINTIKMDPRIGTTHMNVPGPDGQFGWGGTCFPKDTSELVAYARFMNKSLTLLEKSIEVNTIHRGDGGSKNA